MKRRRMFFLSTLLLFLFLSMWPAHYLVRGQSTGFVIDRADATNTLAMTGSSDLNPLIQSAQPRFVLQYANSSGLIPILAPPAGLVILLQSAQDRFVLQYANSSKTFPISPVPGDLSALLETAENRYVLQYANLTHTLALTYPVGLIGDTSAPTVSTVSTTVQGDSLSLTIQTSEYTTAILDIGASPGDYTITLSDDLYDTEHVFTPSGLQTGVTYYYRVTLTDRSGNSTRTPENTFTFTPMKQLYLPLLTSQ
jgi:hypothetical protein